MSKNICRLDGNQIFLSVLRDDEEAVGLYAKWMSDETTCVFIEHAHSVVDITRMPGWVRDHSVMRMGIVLKETDTLIGYCHIDHRTEDMSAWLSINIGEKSVRGKGMIPASEMFHISVAIILANIVVELSPVQKSS